MKRMQPSEAKLCLRQNLKKLEVRGPSITLASHLLCPGSAWRNTHIAEGNLLYMHPQEIKDLI